MASYKVEIARSVEQDLRTIDKRFVPQIFSAIKSLASNPFPEKKCKKLKGSQNCYRLRVGNFRVLYEVQKSVRIVYIYKVRHRKDAYK